MTMVIRALNDYDISVDPLTNGIVSKKVIYELTWNYVASSERRYFNTLSDKEKESYVKERMMDYILKNRDILHNKIAKKSFNLGRLIELYEKGDTSKYVLFRKYLSTLNTHLLYGSSIMTDWISGTFSLASAKKYYDEQQSVHKLALIEFDTDRCPPLSSFAMNVSNREDIKNASILFCNKLTDKDIENILDFCKSIPNANMIDIDYFITRTKTNFRGFNYSISDKEVCFFRNIAKDNIVNVYDALVAEMLIYDILDLKFLDLPVEEQNEWIKTLKYKMMMMLVGHYDPYMFYLYEKLYLDSVTLDSLNLNMFDREKALDIKKKILGLTTVIPMDYIKRKQ